MILLAVFSLFMPQQTTKLQGKYTVQFEKKYELESYQITFNDSTYLRVMRDAFSTKGKISYEKYKATLKGKVDENPIEIDSREFGKDTMKFTTRSKADVSRKINHGLLIRIKK